MYIRPSTTKNLAEIHFSDYEQAQYFVLEAFPYFSQRARQARYVLRLSSRDGGSPTLGVPLEAFTDMYRSLRHQAQLCIKHGSPESASELLMMVNQVEGFSEYPGIQTIPSDVEFSIPSSIGPHTLDGPNQ